MMMRTRLCGFLLLALTVAGSFSSCTSDEAKRKKVIGPGGGEFSNLPWNRPRSWEGNARYGPYMPSSR